MGVKGAGEVGAIESCPAVMNAVIDALWRAFRISHLDMPATPERIWTAIEGARWLRLRRRTGKRFSGFSCAPLRTAVTCTYAPLEW
jgi:hypothetical protein